MIKFLAFVLFAMPTAAQTIGSVEAGGTFIKDEITVSAFADPEVPNITCYVTYYDRSVTMSDSSQTSLVCVQMGPVVSIPPNNKRISSVAKSWLRSTNIARFYDKTRNAFVYLSYSNHGDNANHHMSVVSIR